MTVTWLGTQVLAAALVGSPYSDGWRDADDSGSEASEASSGPSGGSGGGASGEALAVEAAVHAAVHDAVAVCLGCLDPALLPLSACAAAAVLLQLAAQPRIRPDPQVPITSGCADTGRFPLRQPLALSLQPEVIRLVLQMCNVYCQT